MGKRSRRRDREGDGPSSFADLGLDLDLDLGAESISDTVDVRAGDGVLTLRIGMSPGTREEYAALLRGERSTAASAREDTWHRALEFLFERLVVRWEISGVATAGQKDLLARLRVATPAERDAVRDALRAHVAEHLPGVEAP